VPSNATAEAEYDAGLARLARLQADQPDRFSEVLFATGLPHASAILEDLAPHAPVVVPVRRRQARPGRLQ